MDLFEVSRVSLFMIQNSWLSPPRFLSHHAWRPQDGPQGRPGAASSPPQARLSPPKASFRIVRKTPLRQDSIKIKSIIYSVHLLALTGFSRAPSLPCPSRMPDAVIDRNQPPPSALRRSLSTLRIHHRHRFQNPSKNHPVASLRHPAFSFPLNTKQRFIMCLL